MPRLRVLVVEDSLTVRRRLVDALLTDPLLDVVEAGDGKTAIEICQRLRPDVVTLDMLLPEVSGLAVTEYIMAYCPTPILIVSCSTNRGDLFKTYDALAAGALDVLEKPRGDEMDKNWNANFVSRVKLVSRIRVITHVRGRQRQFKTTSVAAVPANYDHQCRLVAIGASTGGPAALVEILRALPAHFPAPILIVLHIGDAFGAMLAEWLDGQSSLKVGCARHGEPLPQAGEGRVVLAPPGTHLVLTGGRLHLLNTAERHSCRPSVDVLFESVARDAGPHSIACLLTGMGKDGAEGLLAIRRAGGHTIAQDEATSVVFGMPREAIRLEAAERVVPLPEIADTLTAWAGVRLPSLARSAL